ncbi:MAG: hypothetical protein P1U87_02800 [Verrucomicrobiales bacterium]|nr:hypothetical protein [Verrucomicrobiales bacterium]
MKNDAPSEAEKKISCAITEKDIRTMLDRFDSGMADLTTSNAVAIALNRELGPDANIRVIGDSVRGEFFLLYNDRKLPLPRSVSVWLSGCFQGIPVEPIHFELGLNNGEDGGDEPGGSPKKTSRDQESSIAA